MANLLQRQSFTAFKERVLTCLVHNTTVPGGIRCVRRERVERPTTSFPSVFFVRIFSDVIRARERVVDAELTRRSPSHMSTRTLPRSPGDFNAKSTSVPGGLPEHIKALKAAVDKQRAEVPALVMKQTSAHLEALQSFDGALEEIENMKRDTENLLKSHGGKGGAAVDVQRDLLEKCEQLPELQRRLQTATAKLGTILSQMDASAAAVEA